MKIVTVQMASGHFLLIPMTDNDAKGLIYTLTRATSNIHFQDLDGEWWAIPPERVEFAYTSDADADEKEEKDIVH